MSCSTRSRSPQRRPSSRYCLNAANLSVERRVQGGGQGRFATHQGGPGELLPLAPALGDELETLRRDREHIGLALDLDLALQRLVELRCHVCSRVTTVAYNWSQFLCRPEGAGRGPAKRCSSKRKSVISLTAALRQPIGLPELLSPPIW